MTMHNAPAAPRRPFHAQPVPQWQMERFGVQLMLADVVLQRDLVTAFGALGATYVDAGYCIDAPAHMPAGSCCGVYQQSLIAREGETP